MTKYLIDIHHGLGDVIHMLPVIYAIKEKNKTAQISLIVSKKYINDFVLTQNIVDEVFILNKKRDLFSLLIRKHFIYDYGIVAPCIGNVRLSSRIMRFMGARIIVYESDIRSKEHHRVDRNIDLVKKIGVKVSERYPKIYLDNESLSFYNIVKRKVNPLLKTIGLCVGGNPEKYVHDGIVEMVDVKRWPIKYYHELVNMLIKKFNIILLGGEADAKEFWKNYKHSDFSGRLIDLLGKTTIMQSAAALKCCDIAAGNDTGMIHVAAALGKKTITVYCSTDPKKIGAYSSRAVIIDEPLECKHCYLGKKTFKCKEKKCLYLIKPIDFYNIIIAQI